MKKITVFLILVLIIIKCAKENNPLESPNNPKELMPLQIGNYWIYEISDYDSVGRLIELSSDTLMITASINYNGLKYYLYNGNTYSGFCNKHDGYYELSLSSYDERLNWKYPAIVGEQGLDGQVVSTTTSKQVPSGNYINCYQYNNYRSNGILDEEWIVKPGLGIIYRTDYNTKSDGSLYLSLEVKLKLFSLK